MATSALGAGARAGAGAGVGAVTAAPTPACAVRSWVFDMSNQKAKCCEKIKVATSLRRHNECQTLAICRSSDLLQPPACCSPGLTQEVRDEFVVIKTLTCVQRFCCVPLNRHTLISFLSIITGTCFWFIFILLCGAYSVFLPLVFM